MDLDLGVGRTSLYTEITQLSTCQDIYQYQSIMRISPCKDPACVFALCFRQSVAHRSVDYGGLGWVINTVISTQAQGLTHSEVITCSPVDCSPSVTQDATLPCRNTELLELKITWKSPLKSYAWTSSFIGMYTFSFSTCSFVRMGLYLGVDTWIGIYCASVLEDFRGAESIRCPLAALSSGKASQRHIG